MKKTFLQFKKIYLMLLGITLSIISVAQPTGSVTLSPTADAFIWQLSPNSNYGSNPDINAGTWTFSTITGNYNPYSMRSFLQFDLSTTNIPAGATITSATLNLYTDVTDFISGGDQDPGGGDDAAVLFQATGAWTEGGLTWNNQPTLPGSPTTVALPQSTSSNETYSLDVKTLVQNMIANPSTNYGFEIKQATEAIYGNLNFGSKENSTSTLRPTLVINFTYCPTVTTTLWPSEDPAYVMGGETYAVIINNNSTYAVNDNIALNGVVVANSPNALDPFTVTGIKVAYNQSVTSSGYNPFPIPSGATTSTGTVNISAGGNAVLYFTGYYAAPYLTSFTETFTVSTPSCSTITLTTPQKVVMGCPASWGNPVTNCNTDSYGTSGVVESTYLSVHAGIPNTNSITFSLTWDPSILSLASPAYTLNSGLPSGTTLSYTASSGNITTATLTFPSTVDINTSNGTGNTLISGFNMVAFNFTVLAKPSSACFTNINPGNLNNGEIAFNQTGGSTLYDPIDYGRIVFQGSACGCTGADATFTYSGTLRVGQTITMTANQNNTGDVHFWWIGEQQDRLLGQTSSPATYSYQTPGTFTITHEIQTAAGVIAFSSQNLTIGRVSSALEFNPSNSEYAEIPDNSAFDLGAGDFTILATIKASASTPGSTPQILSKRTTTSDGFMFGIWNAGSGTGYLFMQLGGTPNHIDASSTNVMDGNCHNVGVSRNGTTCTFFVDGSAVSTFTSSHSMSSSTTQDLLVGTDLVTGNSNTYFDGDISFLQLWDSSMNATTALENQQTYLRGSEKYLVGFWPMDDGSGQNFADRSATNVENGILGTTTSTQTIDPTWDNSFSCSTGARLAYNPANNNTKISHDSLDATVVPDVIIYPNPSSGTANIAVKSGYAEQATANIYNVNGVLVLTINDIKTNQPYKFGQNLATGIYIIEVITPETTERTKWVKLD